MATKRKTKKRIAGRKNKPDDPRGGWTHELLAELCDYLQEGKTIRAFCREHELARASLNRWRKDDPAVDKLIQDARALGAEAIEDEYVETTSEPELVVNVGTKAKPKWVAVSDDVQHRKLKAHGLEKRMAWNNAGRYGDKLQVGGAADLPPVKMSVEERRARALDLIKKARKRKESDGSRDDEDVPTV